jgi:cyclopropane fatty-acyl-phospholipid synthase-like methyltransferase
MFRLFLDESMTYSCALFDGKALRIWQICMLSMIECC